MEIENAAINLPASDDPSPTEVKQSLNALMRAFEEFKSSNDTRLDDMEKHHSADVLVSDKVDRLNAVIGDLSSQLRRPAHDTQAHARAPHDEHKAAFMDYVRSGNITPLLERRSLNEGSANQSGYTTPTSLEARVNAQLSVPTSVRSLATVHTIGLGGSYKKLRAAGAMAVAWVAAEGPRAQTTSTSFVETNVPVHEQYANPAASTILLEDAAVDLEAWIADALCAAFLESEAEAFVQGGGANQPKGIMTYPQNASTSFVDEKIMTVAVTRAGQTFPTDPQFLLNLVYALPARYRQNAQWMMSYKTQAEARKLKDAQDNYAWQPNFGAGLAPTLLGHPVVESEHMGAIGAGKRPVLFGDFRAGYLVVDRLGMQILRDPFSQKPYVLFYTTRRVGGAVQDFDAFRVLKTN